MQECGICQLATSTLRNPFKEFIGHPPAPINELILQCTGITIDFDSRICEKCTSKLSRYYRATQIVHQIEKELLELLHQAIAKNELKLYIDRKSNKNEQLALAESADYDEGNIILKEEFSFDEDDVKNNHIGCSQEEEIFAKECIEFCAVAQSPSVDARIHNDGMKTRSKSSRCEKNNSENEVDKDVALRGTKTTKVKSLGLMCSECGLSFPNKRKYRSHKEAKHSAGFICEQCGKTLQTQSGLLNHIQTHDDAKNFVCSECGQRFKTKYLLRLHMAWHTGERPFECEICHKRYVHRLALTRHKEIHDEQTRRKECKVCGFKFRSTSHLQRHMLTHTGAKPHSCPVCGKCFSQRYNLKVHVQEHEQPGSTRQRRLKCKKCIRTFTNEENYQEHCQRNDCETFRAN